MIFLVYFYFLITDVLFDTVFAEIVCKTLYPTLTTSLIIAVEESATPTKTTRRTTSTPVATFTSTSTLSNGSVAIVTATSYVGVEATDEPQATATETTNAESPGLQDDGAWRTGASGSGIVAVVVAMLAML